MWDEVEPAFDPEGHLLSIGTSLDISGRNPHLWPPSLLTEVTSAMPRGDLYEVFMTCLQARAERKPACAAAGAVRSGIGARMATNPLVIANGSA